MQVFISAKNFKVSEPVREHVDRRLAFALDRFQAEIERIDVTLADLNGPKGGMDKQCRMVAKLRSDGTLVIEDQDMDFYAVIDRAADRLGHAVQRAIDRRRDTKYARRRAEALLSETAADSNQSLSADDSDSEESEGVESASEDQAV
ncbi:MAG TPA: HPF/RaiA family ribosome-associated protein [Thermoguttaceae bacterium]|nr:HPF/RaiA family ribosome-associated protein [Thermoguttaceae bacterium]HPP51506.1 HPF/RaiA family ribosome-associated protein [Thermoguttaceae bacterium]